jgi:hypothetical protein
MDADVESSKRIEKLVLRAQGAARQEAEWFFGRQGGRVPAEEDATPEVRAAAQTVAGWLARLATFHSGALALRFTRGSWPRAVEDYYRGWTGLVVRLECAARPSVGSTEAVERAAALRLEGWITSGTRPRVCAALQERALGHLRLALKAAVPHRGLGPSVVPAAGRAGLGRDDFSLCDETSEP